MLGIHGDDLGPRRGPGRLHHRSAGDERFLVGQRQATTGLQSSQGYGQAGEADDAVHHHVR